MTRRAGLGLLSLTLAACGRTADIVIRGGMVWTGLSSGAPQAGAVAIGDGEILAVGDSAAVARYVGSRTHVIRADGGLVLPGFTDGHTHFIGGGFQLASVDLRNAASPQEFVRRIGEYARTLKPGEWITGGDWDHTLWPGQPLPRHEWIDSVTPANPVFVNRLDGHEALANAAALRAGGVTRDTPTPPGGEILRAAKTGEPIGIFKDQALDLIGRAQPDPSPEQRDSALARALAHAASLGVTATAHMSASWADLASYRRLEGAGRLTMRVAVYLPVDTWRAVGDRANALILAIYDSVIKVHGPRDRRFRVEHAQHLRPQDIPLFGTLGVIASMQPYHAIDDGRWVERRIGPARVKTTYAFRTLLDTGAKLAFGSDWTVAPLDPLAGVYAAVTRRTLDDKHPTGWVPEQKLTVGEALRAYTAGNAFATFDEKKRGALAPGYYADVVVVDR